ncbi:acyl-CoA dehydrogenase family member 10-like [Hibiscus syriacus]|uniref:Acyl-CoA dehydrogenase family member 10-like n=1 Tax=Hibiscus syriacus TaxID=106335 RepID=A0A6A2WXG1_HIBSY|nr:acyl-CoA dehydrogenase family member 10-like [Hibiscus syriacus]
MLQSEGFEEKEKKNLVCRLNKSMYGLKQASRCWYKRFDSFIICLGYNRLNAYPCVYFKRSGDNNFVILPLYVDDMLVAEPNKVHIEELKAKLAREFEMKDLGSTNNILGMQIHRDRSNRKIWLSQKNYLKKILSRFNMQDCKPIYTPLSINFKLSSSMSPNSKEERMEMSQVSYASVVGSLMFAMICTRPDIAQAVGVVSRYMANPGKEHWNTVKRILRYIKGTLNNLLCYGRSNLLINGYVDSDYAGDLDKSKSTTGYVFKVTGGVMLLEELGHNQEHVSLFCNSQSVLHLARNPTFHSRTKHIRVQYHFIREKVKEWTIDMQKIHTKDNIADFMTKAINVDKFTWCRSSYGLSENCDFALFDSRLPQQFKAFSAAWKAACDHPGNSTFYIPEGIFMVGPFTFHGPCYNDLSPNVEIKGTLLAPIRITAFKSLHWIAFKNQKGLTVTGGTETGKVNGQGEAEAWQQYSCLKAARCKKLITSMFFIIVSYASISNITLLNSNGFHLGLHESTDINIYNVNIIAPEDSPNTDGIHVSHSSNISIFSSIIGVGDDCVSVGAGRNNISIYDVRCGPGNGISLGKYKTETDVVGISVRNCTINGTENGIRMKSWSGGRAINAYNMTFEDILMINVSNP